MASAGAKKIVLSILFLAVARRTAGVNPLFNALPCENGPGAPNPSSDPTDNYSCPSTTLNLTQRCFGVDEVCNNRDFCSDGTDEGNPDANTDLDCNGTRTGVVGFQCSSTPTVITDYSLLCNGVDNCEDGTDETRVICENKCLGPYYGGCDYSRECQTSAFTFGCGRCLAGFAINSTNPSGPCLLEIGLERIAYSGSESGQITEEICAVLFVDPSLLANGIDSAFQAIEHDYNINGSFVINALITSNLSSASNAASGSDFQIAAQSVQLLRNQTRPCVTFDVTDDNDVEDPEVFDLAITSSSNFVAIRPSRSTAIVTIIDNDMFVEAVYQPSSYSVNEMAGTASACISIVSRSAAFTTLTAISTVTPSFTNLGDAMIGIDYTATAVPGTLVFPAGTAITTNPATSANLCFDFSITNDNDVEDPETVTLGLASSSGLIDSSALGSTANVIILNDDMAQFRLDMSAYTINETGGSQTVSVELVNNVDLNVPVQVVVTTVNAAVTNPATVDSDYNFTQVILTFGPGPRSSITPLSVDIPIVDDAVLEGSEIFDVELTINSGFQSRAETVDPDRSPVTILDNDEIDFTVSAINGQEGGNNITITVQPVQTIPGPNPIVITLTAISDTATDTQDFNSFSTTLTFPDGSTSADSMTATIVVIDDDFVEGTEQLILTVSSTDSRVTFNMTASPINLDVQIFDNDILRYRLTQDTYTVEENMGPMVIGVELTPDSGIPLTTFTATVSTSDGSAFGSSDFTPLTDFEVNFGPLSNPGTTMNVSVFITNDQVPENTEAFGFTLDSDDTSAVNTRPTANGIINDDDFVVVGFVQPLYTVDEEISSEEVELCIDITSPGPIPRATTVTFNTADGSAAAGMDYTAIFNRAVTFPVNSATGNTQCVTVQIINDDVLETDETFTGSLTGDLSLVMFSRDTTQVNIIETNDGVICSFDPLTQSVPEDNAAEMVCILCSSSTLGSTISIDVISSGGTAAAGLDYNSVNERLTFSPGNMRQCANVNILEDLLVEGDETVSFMAMGVGLPDGVVIGGTPHILTILDDDRIIYGFSQTSYSAMEGPSAVMTVTVELASNSGIPTSPFIALVSTGNGGAVAPDDFISLTDAQVIFPSGSQPGSTQDTVIIITNDSDPENTETFPISVTSNDAGALNVRPTATGIINDDDDIILGFVELVYNVDEEMMPGQVDLCIDIFNSGPLPRTTTVTLDTADDSATAGMDYVAIFNRAVTFPAGSSAGDTQCVTVQIINDNVLEMTGEEFLGRLSGNPAGVIFSRPQTRVVFQESNDEVRCDFEDDAISTVENDVNLMACIRCNTNSLSSPITIDISVNLAGGSATNGADFLFTNEVLTFSSGNMRQCVDVEIEEDLIVEGDETIILTGTGIGLPPGTSVGPAGTTTTTITIIDDDTPSVGIVDPNPPAIPESDDAMVCVEITNGVTLAPGMTVDVAISTRDGSANGPGDYNPVNNVVMTFDSTNSASNLCFNIEIEDDNLCEDTETFFVDLTAGVPVSPSTAVITIEDNDRAEVALTDPQPDMFMDGVYHVTECSDEGFYFDISITNNIQKGPGVSCVISVTTVDATAEAGSDYEALNGNCVLDNSNSECEFHIGIIDDFTAEMTESFYISIVSNDSTRCNIANDLITVNITDDEDCDDDVCDDFEMCEELMCPNNFTCVAGPNVGDDPHFAVTLSSGKTLCYTVQGEHGFAFNLISNKKVYMNAMFVPDKDREEVTWLGTMGIVVANSNGFKKSNMTRLRFEAIKNKIHIDDQMVLDARNIEKITIKNGKLTISEAPPMEGYKQPFVRVDLVDVQLSFSIKFMTEHLDLYWHSTGQNVEDSHGIIGQFFHKHVELDEVRKILLIPGKEPIPVQRKPVWAFMEREYKDNDKFCWVAMNPGFQGEGLIDGKYVDYLVDDVLSTEFKFKKM